MEVWPSNATEAQTLTICFENKPRHTCIWCHCQLSLFKKERKPPSKVKICVFPWAFKQNKRSLLIWNYFPAFSRRNYLPVDNWKLELIEQSLCHHSNHQLMEVGALGYVPKPYSSNPMPPRKASCCCCSVSVASGPDSEEERSAKTLKNCSSFPGQLLFLFSSPRGVSGHVFPLHPFHTAAPGVMLH